MQKKRENIFATKICVKFKYLLIIIAMQCSYTQRNAFISPMQCVQFAMRACDNGRILLHTSYRCCSTCHTTQYLCEHERIVSKTLLQRFRVQFLQRKFSISLFALLPVCWVFFFFFCLIYLLQPFIYCNLCNNVVVL